MELIQKVKALQIGKRKVFRRMLVIEGILIALGIIGLFGKNEEFLQCGR